MNCMLVLVCSRMLLVRNRLLLVCSPCYLYIYLCDTRMLLVHHRVLLVSACVLACICVCWFSHDHCLVTGNLFCVQCSLVFYGNGWHRVLHWRRYHNKSKRDSRADWVSEAILTATLLLIRTYTFLTAIFSRQTSRLKKS